jgi:hypothetical protein
MDPYYLEPLDIFFVQNKINFVKMCNLMLYSKFAFFFALRNGGGDEESGFT